MSVVRKLVITVVILILIAGGGYWWHRHQGQERAEATEEKTGETEVTDVVATVKTLPIRKGTLETTVRVYGTVVPAPGAVQTVSVPFESHVLHVLVSEGQKVSPKQPLLEIEPSPDTHLQLEQAQNSFQSAQKSLKHVQEQFNMKFATNEQLLQVQQAFADAKLKLESLKKRGIDGPRTIQSDLEALVTKVNTQEGALVGAGNSMIDLVSPDQVEVRLGFELEDVGQLKLDQPVFLTRVNDRDPREIPGRIRTISHSINPTTRLVDVSVAPSNREKLFLDGYVVGRAKIARAEGLIVPRGAVLPEEDEHVLYTVKDGHAIRHVVKTGLEDDKETVVAGKDLQAGQRVVVLGNYELKDGMAVKEGTGR